MSVVVGPQHPVLEGALAVKYTNRAGRVKVDTFYGPEATQRAWSVWRRQDDRAREYGRERPSMLRWLASEGKWSPVRSCEIAECGQPGVVRGDFRVALGYRPGRVCLDHEGTAGFVARPAKIRR